MSSTSTSTEAVVRSHLQAFLERKGVAALLAEYHEDARLYSEDRIYRGKRETGEFFAAFLAALPAGAIERFRLRSLHAHDELAYITWSSGDEIPLGTDTFVVADGKIASQTFAMFRA